jgi:hypothetical protein
MAQFQIRERRVMSRRADGLSSVYNLQRKTEYQRTWQHIDLHWHEILQQAVLEGDPEILIQPLRGFPRRGQQPNYSAYDIYEDLRRQYQRGEDFLDSKIGRWNRLFEDWPDITVEFLEPEAKNQFSNIFV